MNDFRQLAKSYIKAGFWVIPVNYLKEPSIYNWRDLQTRPMTEEEVDKYFKNCHGIALLMGGNPSLFAVDFDLKYSLNPNLYQEVKESLPKSLLEKTYVQKTKNGGFHWIYKVPKTRLFGNEKFASRETNKYERDAKYKELYKDPKIEDPIKAANNFKYLVLIESRSGSASNCGGYVLIPPTQGYEYVYGKIKEITEEEYDLLVETLRSFNQVRELDYKDKSYYDNTNWMIDPWEDYNERGDVINLLVEHGWGIVHESNKTIRLKRPGGTTKSSALFDVNRKIFNCFSTSTQFDVSKGYSPSSVFVELECDGDKKLAYKTLINLDFGIKK